MRPVNLTIHKRQDPKRQRKIPLAGIIALLAATLIAPTGCKPPPNQDGSPTGMPRSSNPSEPVKPERTFLTRVRGRAVERGEINASIATTATVVPYRSRLLRTEESGRLRFAQQWREGDFVTSGTLIAKIDSDSLRSEIERGRADVAIQEEALEIGRKSMDSAIREFQTLQDLYSRGIAALKDLDATQLSMERAINSHRQNQINLEKTRATLRTTEERLERLEIIAPFDGILVARSTLEGTKPFSTTFGSETITDFDNRLVSAEFSLCGIVSVDQVLLRCDVTSKDIDFVNLGQRAEATIFAQDDLRVSGSVVDIARSASQDTRAFQVDVLVENPDRTLRPGMFGRVEVITETKRDAINVAKDVLTRRNNRDIVFVAEKGIDVDYHVARERIVELGMESRDKIEITWGLQEGDIVITRGFEILQDNTPVTVVREDVPVIDATAEEELDTPANQTATGGDAAENKSL